MPKKRRGLTMSVAEANAHQLKHGFKPLLDFVKHGQDAQRAADAVLDFEKRGKKSKRLRNVRVREPNKTEREFGVLLQARKVCGELVEYRFEGVRLLWGGGMTYTADWSARRSDGKIEIHETKGDHIFDRDIVRFKGCRAEWQQWFIFHFHQRTKDGQWHQLL